MASICNVEKRGSNHCIQLQHYNLIAKFYINTGGSSNLYIQLLDMSNTKADEKVSHIYVYAYTHAQSYVHTKSQMDRGKRSLY